MDRNVSIITDLNQNKIVLINDIVFKGKRCINWKDVEEYLKQYVDEFFEIADTKDVVYIGADLPDEYANSNYTHKLKGARFALPVFGDNKDVERYNVFHVLMLIRHAKDGKMYLYDIMEIKKETSRLFQPDGFTQ